MPKEIDEQQKSADKLVETADSASVLPLELAQRFEMLELIGTGAVASVYKAKNRFSDQIVAIKLLKKVDELQTRRFKNEAQLVGRLTHPNIVTQYDFGIANGAPYLVMEYVEGSTLAQELKRGRLDSKRFVNIFNQICDALQHAAQSGVVHRDIKPSNILLSNVNGIETAKLADFGIAKAHHVEGEAQTLTQTGEVVGTPLYMSPEQSMGQKLTPISDLYSLGCVMYESLTGQPPIAGTNLLETVYKRLNEDPKRFNELGVVAPAVLEEVTMRCLKRGPEARYKSAADVKAALNGVYIPSTSVSSNQTMVPILIGIMAAAALIIGFVMLNPRIGKEAESLPAGAEHLQFTQEYDFVANRMYAKVDNPVMGDAEIAPTEFQKLRQSNIATKAAAEWDEWYRGLMREIGLKPGLSVPKEMFSGMRVTITSAGDVLITTRDEPGEAAPGYDLYNSVTTKLKSLSHTEKIRFPEPRVKQIQFEIDLGGSPEPYRLNVENNPLLTEP